MPIFEYGCETCGKVIEVLQKAGAAPISVCGDDCTLDGPDAGAGRLVKVLSVTGGYAMGGGGGRSVSEGPSCGACGSTPGSCQFDS